MANFVILTVLIVGIATVHGQVARFEAVGGARDLAGSLLKILDNSEDRRAVIVENWTARPIRFWCASKNDRIRRNGKIYIDLKDQEALAFSFVPNVLPGFSGRTLFWCTFCYKNQRRGWNVYNQAWEKMHNGVPDSGILRWKIIYDSVRWQDDPLKPGWDFKSWPSQGSC